jgi:hypothetical protein
MNRPKCELEECNNEALTLVSGKWICGECYLKILKRMEKEYWKINGWDKINGS